MTHCIRLVILFSLLASSVRHATAEVRLARFFANHMVLQCEKPVEIWGWADKGEKVRVEFAGQVAEASAAGDGAWTVTLKPLKASKEGKPLKVQGGDRSIVIDDVLVGEVWHASGQSNRATTVGAMSKELELAKSDIEGADLPALRFCRINETESPEPLTDLRGQVKWDVCTPSSIYRFSGVAFYYARRLHQELGVPIGVIDSSRGGTPIEPFIHEQRSPRIRHSGVRWNWLTRVLLMRSGNCQAAYERGTPTGFQDVCLIPGWLRSVASLCEGRSGIRVSQTAAFKKTPATINTRCGLWSTVGAKRSRTRSCQSTSCSSPEAVLGMVGPTCVSSSGCDLPARITVARLLGDAP